MSSKNVGYMDLALCHEMLTKIKLSASFRAVRFDPFGVLDTFTCWRHSLVGSDES